MVLSKLLLYELSESFECQSRNISWRKWLFMPHEYSLWWDLSMGTIFFTLWPWPWSLTHYLANNFWTVSVRALIFHMSTPCVKTFQCVPIFLPCDLDLGVWPYFITLTLVKILNSSCYSFGTSHEYYMRQDLSVGTNNFDLVTLEFDLLFMPLWLKIEGHIVFALTVIL